MVWLFQRKSEVITCEVRRRRSHFELSMRRPDGSQTIDKSLTAAELLERIAAAPLALMAEGWQPQPVDLFSPTTAIES